MRARRLVMILAVVGMVMGIMAPAGAGGVSQQKLENAGWFCFPAGPASPQNIHCVNGNQGSGKAANVKVFSGADGSYLGTELLRFTDKDLSDLPCPKDGGFWHDLGGNEWACHHWKGAPA